MLALGIRYLTGYAVATDVSDRNRAEWPPHPARVFMAMAAAHFETGEDPDERAALEWLEGLGPPALRVSGAQHRGVVTHYVPVNDSSLPERVKGNMKAKAVESGLAVLPHLRKKQPRSFPGVHPDNDKVFLVWHDAGATPKFAKPLEGLCKKVIRIGHSSSLVQMWVEEDPPEANLSPDTEGRIRVRAVGEGTLEYLERQFNAEPEPQRPVISLWQTYSRAEGTKEQLGPACGPFARDLLVLAIQQGPGIGLETTWQFLTALRDTILSQCDPTPEWLSGHKPDRSPSERPHLAFVPLPFVGHPHADGHLLGVGLAFPQSVSPRERGRALSRLLFDEQGRARHIQVNLGKLGAWQLVRETRESPPAALQSRTWTGPSRTWATITPIVLDRHPKSDYRKDRCRWQQEVADSIAKSCQRQGLPEPAIVDVDKTCWHRGGPRAVPGKSGFPLMPVKAGQSKRQQVHAWIRFGQDVEGPLLLGAGRYRGYGVCKPWEGER